ncbi:MAG TPA: S-methyl-5-thioribose-1-phosphate isomerase [Steroidobacteraceae bacterium]|jgi:methylthioribose-1-phosphate isomerase|nr:S-methyl-5-thioribose-1-phosphate isomerase [Steroidobacteraceae bacterium]
MNVNGQAYRTIWLADDGISVRVIDQRRLPHEFTTLDLRTLDEALIAIKEMAVRGAPLIGATAAFAVALALRADPSDAALAASVDRLVACRPTAVNLAWAARTVASQVMRLPTKQRWAGALAEAQRICEDDVSCCRAIGAHGADLLASLDTGGRPIQILTHCNAGWLATVDWGTALSPIYVAQQRGLSLHVWVDETRPRNQGAALTAWELGQQGIPHTVIADNAGGYLMRQGRVDLCIVGADRVAGNGDVCNKIGTYLKALAAFDNRVPFYVAMPHSTIDWNLSCADHITIEQRDPDEVRSIVGLDANGKLSRVQLTPPGSAAANFAFDVTPARLVTGLITERGIARATRESLAGLYGIGSAVKALPQ